MSSTYQTLQCLLDPQQRVGVLFHYAHSGKQKSMQNHKPPSFFLTKTTALHHTLWLSQIVPDSSISQRWFGTSSTRGGGICLNHSLKGVSICHSDCMLGRVSAAQLCRVLIERHFGTGLRASGSASANSGGHESNPLRSSLSNNFPCLCLTVTFECMSILGLILPLVQMGLHQWSWCHWLSEHSASSLEFSFGASGSRSYCSLLPQLHSYYLVSTLCMIFCMVRPCMAKSLSPACNAWVMMHWYVLWCEPFLPSHVQCRRRKHL